MWTLSWSRDLLQPAALSMVGRCRPWHRPFPIDRQRLPNATRALATRHQAAGKPGITRITRSPASGLTGASRSIWRPTASVSSRCSVFASKLVISFCAFA